MAMTMSSAGNANAPMMDINTTPLIDVLLVLLIMFILTIPVQTHAVKLDAGRGVPPPIDTRPSTNEIAITDGNQLLWNGAPVDLITLRMYLDQSQTLDPIPELHIRPSAHARYDLVDRVLAVAKRARVTRMGIVGNDAYARDF